MLGYFLGETFPALGENIDYAVLAILAFSVIPFTYECVKHRRRRERAPGRGRRTGRRAAVEEAQA